MPTYRSPAVLRSADGIAMSGTAALFTEPARKGGVQPWAGDFRPAADTNAIKNPVGKILTLGNAGWKIGQSPRSEPKRRNKVHGSGPPGRGPGSLLIRGRPTTTALVPWPGSKDDPGLDSHCIDPSPILGRRSTPTIDRCVRAVGQPDGTCGTDGEVVASQYAERVVAVDQGVERRQIFGAESPVQTRSHTSQGCLRIASGCRGQRSGQIDRKSPLALDREAGSAQTRAPVLAEMR